MVLMSSVLQSPRADLILYMRNELNTYLGTNDDRI
jgi:hypothetical protein